MGGTGGVAALCTADTEQALTRYRERARGWAVCGTLAAVGGAGGTVAPLVLGHPVGFGGPVLLAFGLVAAMIGFGSLAGARCMEDALTSRPWTPLRAVRVPGSTAVVVRDPASAETWPLTVRTVPWRRHLVRPDAHGEMWWCGNPEAGGALTRPGGGDLLRAQPVRGSAREALIRRATASWASQPTEKPPAADATTTATATAGPAQPPADAAAGPARPAADAPADPVEPAAHAPTLAGPAQPLADTPASPADTARPATDAPASPIDPARPATDALPLPAPTPPRRGVWRWVVAVGGVVLGFAVLCESSVADDPRVEVTVEARLPDGSCTVSWTDPFDGVRRTGPYRCAWHPRRPFGEEDEVRETGHVVSYGPWQGDLYNADGEGTRVFVETRALEVLGGVTLFVGLAGGADELRRRRRKADGGVAARAQAS
ncbi:hypothetical protein [Streptomyces sp. NPDC053431]|uniref:hypothetical protein n=1 Tax=Streptomyces sp. NPDC053431 TaxID=3365703 RepID=UPI0037CEFFB6